MEEYVKEAKRASTNDEIVGLYDKELHEEKLRITELEEARDEGEKKGLAIGKKQGLVLGEKKGIIETAKKFLKEKVDIDIITKCTGLTKEEIEKLKA